MLRSGLMCDGPVERFNETGPVLSRRRHRYRHHRWYRRCRFLSPGATAAGRCPGAVDPGGSLLREVIRRSVAAGYRFRLYGTVC